MTVTFTVFGVPQPQGSKRIGRHGQHAVILDANDAKLRPWRDSVAAAARDAMEGVDRLDGPVAVDAVFTLPRPKSRPLRDRYPDRRPDLDKAARGLLDGLTGPVFVDDAQVCRLVVEKRYVGDTFAALPEPGVTVLVRSMR